MACLFFLLFSQPSFAKFLKDEVSLVHEDFYSFNEVCKKMLKRDSPLIEYVSVKEIDCMGTKVLVKKFCESAKEKDPLYIRGIALKDKKQIVCKSASKVVIKYQCEKETSFCRDPEVGCFQFQEELASRLKLSYFSKTKEGRVDVLNCYYLPKTKEQLPQD